MYCPHCMKKIPTTATTCPLCSQATHTPVAGMATLRVSCRPKVHFMNWIMFPPLYFFKQYKIHISVDDKNYVLKSKKKQLDIPVSVGTHYVRISALSKKSAKALKFAGTAMAFTGAVTGSGSAIYAGAAIEEAGAAIFSEGIAVSFESNELVPISVKQNWLGAIVEDKDQ